MRAPLSRDNVRGMRDLADSYARELEAQFRTLNLFASHAGEIGRAHEQFLRSVLQRFLPEPMRLGTGFAASPTWTSTQQDILIYSPGPPLLFQAGDCVVVDSRAVNGFIEVKTNFDSDDLDAYLEKILDLDNAIGLGKATALYAWDGLSVDSVLERVWDFVRKDPARRRDLLPTVIYVRSKFLLFGSNGGNWWDGPLRVMRLGEQSGLTDGDALLGFVGMLWYRLRADWPWWLDWHERRETFPPIPWPDDLHDLIQRLLPGHPAPERRPS